MGIEVVPGSRRLPKRKVRQGWAGEQQEVQRGGRGTAGRGQGWRRGLFEFVVRVVMQSGCGLMKDSVWLTKCVLWRGVDSC